jgi:hypothetical protein
MKDHYKTRLKNNYEMEALGWFAQHRHAFNQVDDKGFVTAKLFATQHPLPENYLRYS